MSLICEFFGIKISIYWDEHFPPHFHTEYGEIHKIEPIR